MLAHPAIEDVADPEADDYIPADGDTTVGNKISDASFFGTAYGPQDQRESNSYPLKIGRLLDGMKWDRRSTLVYIQSCMTGTKYNIILGFMMLCIMAMCGGAVYFETQAYLTDEHWNQISLGKERFPQITNEGYFGGKFIDEVPEVFIFPNIPNISRIMKEDLVKNQHGERVFLITIFIFGAFAILHFLLFLTVRSFRRRLFLTYLLYILLGILVLIGSLAQLISIYQMTEQSFAVVRILIEDVFGLGENVSHPNLLTERVVNIPLLGDTHKKSHHEIVLPTENCFVHNTTKNRVQLHRLHQVAKMCVYQHVTISSKDPCKHIPIPDKIKLPFMQSPNKTSYSLRDLQDLEICSDVGLKQIALILASSAGLLCLCLAQLGTFAEKHLPAFFSIFDSAIEAEQARVSGIVVDPSERRIPSEFALAFPRVSMRKTVRGSSDRAKYRKTWMQGALKIMTLGWLTDHNDERPGNSMDSRQYGSYISWEAFREGTRTSSRASAGLVGDAAEERTKPAAHPSYWPFEEDETAGGPRSSQRRRSSTPLDLTGEGSIMEIIPNHVKRPSSMKKVRLSEPTEAYLRHLRQDDNEEDQRRPRLTWFMGDDNEDEHEDDKEHVERVPRLTWFMGNDDKEDDDEDKDNESQTPN